MIEAFHLDVCPNSLMSTIRELGYTQSVARCCPLLKNQYMKCQLKSAPAHKNQTVEDRKQVLFTDEMSIKVGQERTSVVYVWRKHGEKRSYSTQLLKCLY